MKAGIHKNNAAKINKNFFTCLIVTNIYNLRMAELDKIDINQTLEQAAEEVYQGGNHELAERIKDVLQIFQTHILIPSNFEEVNARLLTTGEAATALGISLSTVKRWADKGILEGIRFGGPKGWMRITQESINHHSQKNQPKSFLA
jgi:excisionase family DNA binding protein